MQYRVTTLKVKQIDLNLSALAAILHDDNVHAASECRLEK